MISRGVDICLCNLFFASPTAFEYLPLVRSDRLNTIEQPNYSVLFLKLMENVMGYAIWTDEHRASLTRAFYYVILGENEMNLE